MTDGPHRSLKMRPHWKSCAERAANLAHTPDDVREAMAHGLKKDILGAPIQRVREINDSSLLFPSMRVEQLEELRRRFPGSAAAHNLINCAVEAVVSGLIGDIATERALEGALEDSMRAVMRGMDEHYQREAGAHASRIVRGRLDEGFKRLDCLTIARELLSPEGPPSRRSLAQPRRTGLDEGPPL